MGAAELDQRKEEILRAIVRDFILDGQPVGSKRVADELHLGVSAATVRSDMAELEHAGLIRQPHTSAGRVPTDAGYRYYVDHLTTVGLSKPAHPDTVDQVLLHATDVEDLLRRTSSVLSRLTRLTALVTAPRLDRSKLRHVELVTLSPHAILLVFIADTGRVEKRILDLDQPVADDDVQRARYVINDAASGLRLTDAHDAITGVSLAAPSSIQPLLDRVATTIRAGATSAVPEVDRVFVGGAAQLALRATDETVDRLADVYDMLEEQVVLLSMLRETLTQDDPAVRIGSELSVDELSPFAMVASTYGSGQPLGSLGLLGPTRMDYGQAMATVQAVATSLERALAALTGVSDS